ncbi:uncharacterized protein LOC116690165 isoform X1 [Etheostoma spectabile]|uniref:uncharacterized protein LOC116684798 isoform X1 n=2 Tax=Etheostoma spectabile TaxID=54343 RepID=UPI0013AE9440|nr:uncharacterized protein LOC116684798 isoform X1 [Etheostoma spectabile]XP_032372834.1 uncharacterized protein LOC116690165 isoform X1 [Etheostoma spectabile]
MRAVKLVGCVMNDRRMHRAECAAGKSMYVHSKQKRNFQSKPFHKSPVFPLLPPRPRSDGDTLLSSRGSKLMSLQVQGFCCPLQQRPSSGRVTQRVTPPSREGGEGSLTMLSSIRGRLESTGSRPKRTPEGRPPTVCHPREPVQKTPETCTTPCNRKRQARHGHPGTAKVSQLHLYLPSSLGDDEEQDAATEEMRTPAEETSAPESKVNPSHTRGDQPNTGPDTPHSTPSDSTAERSSF